MRDDHGAVGSLRNDGLGVFEGRGRVAALLLGGGFAVLAHLVEVLLVHKVRENFVVDLDARRGVPGDVLVGSRHDENLVSRPEDLRADVLDDVHLHAGQLFSRRGVNRLDLGVGVGRAHDLAVKHPRTVHVEGVLGLPAGFCRAVDAVEALAD